MKPPQRRALVSRLMAVVWTLVGVAVCRSSSAYEFVTHAMMTREAFARSSLSLDASAYQRLQLSAKVDRLSKIYIHLGADGPAVRQSRPRDNPEFSVKKIGEANFLSAVGSRPELDSIAGWF